MRRFLFLLLGGVLFFTPLLTQAMTVSPLVFDEITVDPGISEEVTIKVYNETEMPQEWYFTTVNFGARGETGQADILFGEDPFGLATWIKPEVEKVVLDIKQEQEVKIKIEVPADAEPGGHYAVLFLSDQPPKEGEEAVKIGGNVGILFLVRVSGDVIESAEILDFNYLKKVQTSLPVDFYYRVANYGTVHFKPKGEILIKNFYGRTVDRIDANPLKGNALPDSVRRIETQWLKHEVENPDEIQGFWANFKYEWQNFALGPYKAQLDAVYGDEGESLTAQTNYFWVLPWHIIVVFAVLLIVFIIVMMTYNKMVVKVATRKRNNKQE